jgi:membrane protease YdiL (CAAX protease family)
LAIGALDSSFLSGAAWFVAPGILVAAAIIPTVVKRRKFADIGFNIKQIRNSLMVLGRTCMVVFPVTFFGCWLLKSYGLDLPLRPMLPGGQNWACWLFYQFMYVAVAEEVFFRGYVQGNILRLTSTVKLGQYGLQQWLSIALSAACFAAAHIIVQGQIISVLTFLPGLILGWLFIRTRSLLAPILFHGLANICYFLMAAAFA